MDLILSSSSHLRRGSHQIQWTLSVILHKNRYFIRFDVGKVVF